MSDPDSDDIPESPTAPPSGKAASRASDKVELDLDDALFLRMEEEPEASAEPDAPGEPAPAATARHWPSRKLLVLLGAGLLLLAALSAGAWFLLRPAHSPHPTAPTGAPAPAAAPAQPQAEAAYPCVDRLAPAEAIELARQAALLLASRGEAALKEFRNPKGRWSCPESGLVVFDSSRRTQLVNPAAPRLVGLDISADRSPDGIPYIQTVGELGSRNRGGWMEKIQPRPGVVGERGRKVFYILGVPGTPYQVGAGFYDDATPLAELDRLIPAD